MIKSRLMEIMVRRGSDSWIFAAADPGVPEVLDLACAKINEPRRRLGLIMYRLQSTTVSIKVSTACGESLHRVWRPLAGQDL
jgi:hypothetical protein